METSIWIDIIKLVAAFVTGGGLWAWIKAREDKRKTPYDMMKELLTEQAKFYEQRNADYEKEKRDSAEKSHVIMQTAFCKHKYTNPDIVCPVDIANNKRLADRCKWVGCPLDQGKENEQN